MANRVRVGGRTRLVVGTSLALVGSLLVLTGCSSPDHVSAKLENGAVSFVSCEDFSANGITLEAAALKGKSFHYKTMWVAAGAGTFGPKTAVVLGVPPTGFHTTVGPHAFTFRKVEIQFWFNRDSRPGALGTTDGGIFDGSKLVDGRWLRWDGSVADAPC